MEDIKTRGGWFGSGSLTDLIIRFGAILIVDAFALWFILQLFTDQSWFLLLAIVVVTIGFNVFFLRDDLQAYRWFSPGLALIVVMVLYPTIFTVYVAFTNYRDGNLLTRQQAVEVLESNLYNYLPADAPVYSWTAFRSTSNPDDYALWLIPQEREEGSTEAYLATEGSLTPAEEVDLGGAALDDDGIPEGIAGYERLGRGQLFQILDSTLSQISFGDPENVIRLSPTRPLDEAAVFRAKYSYDEDAGVLTDNETGVTYTAQQGTFTAEDGSVIRPGYYVPIGLDNFVDMVSDEDIRGPFIRVFLWTVGHALLTVIITFSAGLLLALVLNADFMPGRNIMRTLLLVPYAIPAFITVLVWRGLLNPQLGIINDAIETFSGQRPEWFADQNWAKVGILLIQLWLGFPYMMLICTGALQSIPKDIYSAAEVDGANTMQQFRFMTLPLLLVTLGPLLIASFAFNFNNFTVVELYAEGGPPIPNSAAGHTDILITYTYSLAFGSGRGADYAFASAISLMIFIIVATITFFNFRLTRTWEEISENV